MKKSDVRDLATEYGLGAMASKPDSQEICFVQGKSYRDFVEDEVPKELLKSGNLVDREGKVLGVHTGIYQYTIGQRKGLGIFAKDPLFVLALRPDTNEVVVGEEKYLFRKYATVNHLNWINDPVTVPTKMMAKIRYRSTESPVHVTPLEGNRIRVDFEIPQRAITPGQALVLYEGERVVGGGWIEDLSLE